MKTIINVALVIATLILVSALTYSKISYAAPSQTSCLVPQTLVASVPVKIATECSCVETARLHGLDLPKGNAVDLIPNSTPQIGGGILFTYGSGIQNSHIAVILAFLDEGFSIVEGNFYECQLSYRTIDYNDPFIRGFWVEEI